MNTTAQERLAVANEIWQQIRATKTFSEIMSWGVSKKTAIEYEGMPALGLRVSGLLHKGWVIIALNYGTDSYKVTFAKVNGEVKSFENDLFCDNLGDFIDRKIERGDFSEAEYKRRALADSQRKFNLFI